MSQQINLFNPLFLKQEKHFSARTMAQALGIVAIGLISLSVYALIAGAAAEHAAEQQRSELARQRDQLLKLGTQLASRGMDKALEAELARAEAELKAKRATIEALGAGVLGNTAGFSDFFAAFGRRAMPGVWLTGFSIGDAGNELVVAGRALRPDLVPAYLHALNSEPMMRGRQVIEMRLAAREVAASPEKARSEQPERYVEFVLNVPLRAAKEPRP
ncbi:hypothetical protein AYO46_06840 [Betaproteobacteria bacterium SCGC AG-212-J23]|nr:hypothetical protein AYO46_06840 [Betaproteobacteria bacterium SCGC AG-212-J23]